MSDDFSDRRDGTRATTSFEEWLDRHAETEGISKQELFERLVSSYWTLNEMIQLLDDSGSDASIADIYHDGDDAGTEPAVAGSGGDTDGDVGRSRESGSGTDDTGRSRGSDRVEPDRGDRSRIAVLRDWVGDVESRLDDERERGQSQDRALEAIADRVSGIEADLEALAAESEAGRESLAAEYESLAGRLDDLESDVDGRHEQLAGEQKRLRSRLDAEFEDLETILEYLVTRTDDLDAGVAAVEQRHGDELSRLRREREALQSVLDAAAEHDAHAGECEACGERIDLGLLAEPYCPQCDSMLTGVEERHKWLFLSDVVVTADPNSSRGNRHTDPAEQAGGSAMADPAERDGDDGASSVEFGDVSDPDRPPSAEQPAHHGTGRTRPAGTDPEPGPARRGTESGSGVEGVDPVGLARDGAEDVSADDEDVSADDGDESSANDGTDSPFSFGEPVSEAPGSGAENGGGSDVGAATNAPFGDLEDLEREERRGEEE